MDAVEEPVSDPKPMTAERRKEIEGRVFRFDDVYGLERAQLAELQAIISELQDAERYWRNAVASCDAVTLQYGCAFCKRGGPTDTRYGHAPGCAYAAAREA